MFGDDDNGYTLLNRAIDIATTLGYIGVHNSSNHFEELSSDIVSSSERTAWGLYQVDT